MRSCSSFRCVRVGDAETLVVLDRRADAVRQGHGSAPSEVLGGPAGIEDGERVVRAAWSDLDRLVEGDAEVCTVASKSSSME